MCNRNNNIYTPNNHNYFLIVIIILCASYFVDAQTAKVHIPSTSKQVIHGKIVNENGEPLIAQIQVWYYNFQEVVFNYSSEEVEGRTDNLIGMTYSSDDGFYSIKVPADTLLLIISKGPEWELIYRKILVNENEFDGIEHNVKLNHIYNLKKLGWYGGDTHLHSIYSDGRQTPTEIAHALKGVGLSWGILTDHNSIAGMKEWLGCSNDDFITINGNEISTEASLESIENGYGHMNQTFINELNESEPQNPNIWARSVFNNHNDVQDVINQTHAQKGLLAINHPFQNWDWAGRFKSWGEIKSFDAIEVWNCEPPHSLTTSTFDPNLINRNTFGVQSWFSYLNCGIKLPGLAGSDSHDITGVNAYPKGEYFWNTTIGNPRTYAYMDDLDNNNIKSALKHSNLFLTSGFGPLLLVEVDNEKPGEIIESTDNEVMVSIEVLANHPLLKSNDAVRIIYNGEIVKSIATDSMMTFHDSIPISVNEDGWIIVEVFGEWPMFAITNPIFVDVPPLGEWPKEGWIEPEDSKSWNKFLGHPEISIPDGPSNWENSKYIFDLLEDPN
jgi:hypothetical protein